VLRACLGDTVATMIFAKLVDEKNKELTEVEKLKEARQLAVKSRYRLVHRLKLGAMVQGGDETNTSVNTWLKPLARSGRFHVECAMCKGLAD
jgi:hypothetical protein